MGGWVDRRAWVVDTANIALHRSHDDLHAAAPTTTTTTTTPTTPPAPPALLRSLLLLPAPAQRVRFGQGARAHCSGTGAGTHVVQVRADPLPPFGPLTTCRPHRLGSLHCAALRCQRRRDCDSPQPLIASSLSPISIDYTMPTPPYRRIPGPCQLPTTNGCCTAQHSTVKYSTYTTPSPWPCLVLYSLHPHTANSL